MAGPAWEPMPKRIFVGGLGVREGVGLAEGPELVEGVLGAMVGLAASNEAVVDIGWEIF